MAPLREDFTDASVMATDHAAHHNALADAVNDLVTGIINHATAPKVALQVAGTERSYLTTDNSGTTRLDGDGALHLAPNNGGGGMLEIATDGKLWVGELSNGSLRDTNLYRSAANTLKTDDSFYTGNPVRVERTGAPTQYIQISGGDVAGHYITTEAASAGKHLTINVNGVAGVTPGYIEFQQGAVKRIIIDGDGLRFGSGEDTNLYRVGADNLGTDDRFGIIRPAVEYGAITAQVAGDSSYRYMVFADGKQEWGDGTAARDTNLYRGGANQLATDDQFMLLRSFAGPSLYVANTTAAGSALMWIGNANSQVLWSQRSGESGYRYNVSVDGVQSWGDGTAAADTNLYRSAANVLKTDDTFQAATDIYAGGILYLGLGGDTYLQRASSGVISTAAAFRAGVFTTAGRPTAASAGVGGQIYDTTLSKPTWSDGTNWRDAAGTIV